MNVRALMRRVTLAVAMAALVFAPTLTPANAVANDLPQSDGAHSGSGSNAEPGDTDTDPLGEPTPSGEAPQEAGADEPDEFEPPAFDSTYLDLIVSAVEENPDLTINELAEVVGLPEDGPLSLIHVDGKLSVTITFAEAPTPAELAEVSQHSELRRVLDVTPTAMAYAKPTDLAGLRDLPSAVGVEVNLEPETSVEDKEVTEEEKELLQEVLNEAGDQEETASASGRRAANCRSIPAAANAPLKVTGAHQDWGVDGTGVTVGILSTTYEEDPWALTTAKQDVQNGLLPGVGNPCGYTTPVRVLNEGDAPGYLRNDEGRAMAQVVHGIAPGAKIVVATLGQSQEETAQNIADLVRVGANVIADDIVWSGEPSFQKGVISQQIDNAKSKGVTYFTSSGNNNGVQAALGTNNIGYPVGRHQSNKYVPVKCPAWVKRPEGATSYDCMDFSPNGANVPYGRVKGTPPQGSSYAWLGSFPQILSWSEPVNGVKTKLQLQLYGVVEDEKPQRFCFGGASSATASDRPTRMVQWENAANCTPFTHKNYSAALVVVRDTSKAGYGAPMVRITPFGPSSEQRPSWRQFHKTEGNNVIQGSQLGHNGDGSAASIAAAPVFAPTTVEYFSSLGGNQQWFGPVKDGKIAGNLPQKVTPPSPVLMGLDAIPTSFFGDIVTDPTYGRMGIFFGTSAAAPAAAAVAALGLQKNPGMSPATVLKLMEETANDDVVNPYAVAKAPKDRVVGKGLINAQAFLNKVSGPPAMVIRLAGSNRYGTNDAVNARFGVRGGPIFVATGADFADALSIGPVVGIRKGTLFLTPRKTIPPETLAAMKALAPSAVYVVGGTGAVSDEVVDEVRAATGKNPQRVSGVNRYGTSEAIYKQFFGGGAVSTAFVATGRDFPDALSAASAGSALKAPVLLVDGKTGTSLSPYLVESLKAKKTSKVLVSGGAGAVNQTIESSLKKDFSVERLSGPNRYSTNAKVNDYVKSRAGATALTRVFIATGKDFPDALSVAAPSGTLASRLVLSNGNCVPKPVVSEWIKPSGAKVKNVYLAGGTGVLNQSVADLVECN